jgi:NMD protein affecting ribosome stability and mRNA decay
MITSVTSYFVSTHVVRVPYSSQELSIETAAGTTCVKCGTDTTSRWYGCKDKPGTKFCVTCYQKNLLDVAAAAGTTCVKCGTDTTRGQWLNCKDEPGIKICLSCYSKDSYKKKKAAKANDK